MEGEEQTADDFLPIDQLQTLGVAAGGFVALVDQLTSSLCLPAPWITLEALVQALYRQQLSRSPAQSWSGLTEGAQLPLC
jgi:hypothetical protein